MLNAVVTAGVDEAVVVLVVNPANGVCSEVGVNAPPPPEREGDRGVAEDGTSPTPETPLTCVRRPLF